MLAVAALPAAALLVGMTRVPESPPWLLAHGRRDEALGVLSTIRTPERAEEEVEGIERSIGASEGPQVPLFEALRERWAVRILLVGIGIGVAQQLTGINSIMYYGQSVLKEAGFDHDGALVANIAPGAIAVIGGLIGLRLMQTINRRTTLLLGYSLTTAMHFLIGIASVALPVGTPARPFVILVLVVAFVGSMQTFLNIVTWVMLSEIFPLRIRGVASASRSSATGSRMRCSAYSSPPSSPESGLPARSSSLAPSACSHWSSSGSACPRPAAEPSRRSRPTSSPANS